MVKQMRQMRLKRLKLKGVIRDSPGTAPTFCGMRARPIPTRFPKGLKFGYLSYNKAFFNLNHPHPGPITRSRPGSEQHATVRSMRDHLPSER